MKKSELKKIIIEEILSEVIYTPLEKEFLKISGTKRFGSNTPEYKKMEIIGNRDTDWKSWVNGAAKKGFIIKFDNNNDEYIVTHIR